MLQKRPALGKGLSALIPDVGEMARVASTTDVEIDRLSPNRLQPRGAISDVGVQELAQSIAANGIIQPIVVQQVGAGYQIIAGERRWRAAKLAGLTRVPIVVKEVPAGADGALLQMALIENIQRENLNAIEEGLAYRRLVDEFGMTQEAVAAAVGKDRASIANSMRLLKLPDDVREEVASGRLSMGHARALLSLRDDQQQKRIAQETIARDLSVRETESLVKKIVEGPSPERTAQKPPVDVHTRVAEDQLKLLLGTRVQIVRRRKGGRIQIEFKSEEELIRIYDQLTDGRRQ